MADWNYEFAHCLEITVYTGCCHSPSEATLSQLWKAHYSALVAAIKQVHKDTERNNWRTNLLNIGLWSNDLDASAWIYLHEYFLLQSQRGVGGLVTDIQQNPVENAVITVNSGGGPVSSGPSGSFWKILPPGLYTLTATADGYSSAKKVRQMKLLFLRVMCRVSFHNKLTECCLVGCRNQSWKGRCSSNIHIKATDFYFRNVDCICDTVVG